MSYIDINCDLGESFGEFVIGQDDQILPHITSANVACGYHAGDHNVMAKTVKLAAVNNVKIGAHPGYADLSGFGRRVIDTTPDDIYHFTIYQISALQGFCHINKTSIHHVKPHGALYNVAAANREVAQAIANAVYDCNPNLVLYGLAGSELIKAGVERGLKVANEVFADRTYQADGTLTPRTHVNALIKDVESAVSQVINMVKNKVVKAVDGSLVPIQADTVCVHGDGEHALAFVLELNKCLEENDIKVHSL
ncbi:5-oxoprolinase subunit PxpA [Halalkalibacter akibai]|uniref:5-oxoprolinase subunit A n=1 Tax=Halalkalibacter akibai (strain ATCC 43226 / DSM 21942 / CIP 109018 / JCM 9157 / 1139) TaxID=1236973 RepID=W4QYA3_HALA3|nr:5-oxoprolinase subunit PxpA [Halalkalibacter akibai]GAE36882.1 lactam utilization protein LamB [Halalkalibacter akibai JCM 9157]